MLDEYLAAHARSLSEPDAFWAEAAAGITWFRRWDRVLDDSRPPFYRWFTGGLLNTCYNAVDRHVLRGRGTQPALIYDSPLTETVQTFTYADLLREVSTLAGALASSGLHKGDRVIIYMPGVPEAVFAMLACARLGVIHSVVFGGFASNELATRIDDAKPKLVLTASCGIEPNRIVAYKPLLDRAIELAAHKPERCVVLQRPQLTASLVEERDVDWATFVREAAVADCVPLAATDPLYIHYTSGTTGVPKGVVRDNGGHAVALKYAMERVFCVGAGEVFWAASDIGWTVGHGFIVYGPLLHGATTILYEGKPVGTPDAGAFWRVCSQHRVNVLFTAPTAIRAIKREDPAGASVGDYDLTPLRLLFLAGERCDPDTLGWAADRLGIPVLDHWWQTELGWPAIANCAGFALQMVKPGSPTRPVPGYDIRVLDDEGHEAPPNAIGNIVIRLPLPPGTLPTLWHNDAGYEKSYLRRFPGYYLTGDAGYRDPDGYLYVMSRVDDIINVAGHRLSTGGIEEVLASHPDVAECAVVGRADELKGEVPIGFVVLKAGVSREDRVVAEQLVERVRQAIGAFACFRDVFVVTALPKTRSGKILRGTIKKIADRQEYGVPATIEDASVLEGIANRLR
ncbi:MAG: propionyl-CoA synthetase [Vicinamibacterales bacterium]